MPEQVTANAVYLPEIECEATERDAAWEMVVTVQDEAEKKQNLSVSKGMVTTSGGKNYLTAGVMQIDHGRRRVLIELPREADSGVSRFWAPFHAFRPRELS